MSDQIINRALSRLGLQVFEENFNNEHIEANMVASLTDNELIRLGLDTIGSRPQFKKNVAELLNSSELTTPPIREDIIRERARLFGAPSTSSRSKSKNKRMCTRTWSMQFLCLSDKNMDHIPSGRQKEMLNNAGLGVKKIQIGKDDNEKEITEKIMSEDTNYDGEPKGFPQLKNAGGFELLRANAGCKKLSFIDCKWNAKELRKNVNCQSNIYIRPIQKNLSTKPLTPETPTDDVKTACVSCGLQFPVKELRNHVETCETYIYVSNEEAIVTFAAGEIVDTTNRPEYMFVDTSTPIINTVTEHINISTPVDQFISGAANVAEYVNTVNE